MSDETERDDAPTMGRPPAYKPEFVDQVAKLCALGATDEEIAEFFGVAVRTIYRWKVDHEDFCQAIKVGKDPADDRVERSLYQKATGFYVTEEQAFKVKTGRDTEKVEVVKVERYVPPDTSAEIFWLKNRRNWRDKSEHEVKHTLDDALKALADPQS